MTRPQLLTLATLGALLVVLFAPALVGRASFDFRDAAHFYHPLYEYVRGQWGDGRIPLWNPYENLGGPLAGDATAAVFYPGKLLFALPLDYTLLYNWYIVGHVALAAATAVLLARHLGGSWLASGLGAMAYAFSGSVLFQYCNVVYLVGAAWLPLAVLAADQLLGGGSWRAALGLGAVLALMVTGGDPQMAYHAGLIAVLGAWVYWRSARADTSRRQGAASGDGDSSTGPDYLQATFSVRHAVVLLALAATVAALLGAVQILPAWEATRLSTRARYDAPRNVYELAGAAFEQTPPGDQAAWYAGLIGATDDAQSRHIYQFNVGPWRAAELLWPNVSGRMFPRHRRWIDALPAEGRAWTPSLYMGLVPLVLAATAFGLGRSSPPQVRWMSWVAVLSALASLGVYGLAWLVREAAGWCGATVGGGAGDEVGGLYWLMTVVLPGYVYFRYPAKLLVPAALGVSMLAARGWDFSWQQPTRGLRRGLFAIAVLSTVAAIVVVACRSTIFAHFAEIPPNVMFGPFDAEGAFGDILLALAQSVVVAAAALALVSRRVRAVAGPWAVAGGLLLTALDLAVAHSWLVSLAPADAWRGQPNLVHSLPPDGSTYRIYRDEPWLPRMWRETSAGDRLQMAQAWDRGTFSPRYPLPLHASLVEAPTPIALADYRTFMDVARHGRAGATPPGRPHPSVLNLLGVRLSLLSAEQGAPSPDRGPFTGNDLAKARRPFALRRAWIVHEWETLPELVNRAPVAVDRRTREVLFPAGRPRDWARAAVVESDSPLEFARTSAPGSAPGADAGQETCRVVSDQPDRVVIEATLRSAGLVVLADTYYPGWTLAVESAGALREIPILRTNRVLRGAALPAGEHRLTYRYRPASVRWGAATSALAAVGACVALGAARTWRRRRRVPAFNATGH